ncbi:MAG: hypothetical protein QM796_10390 [Chthoniobacteraceae bacterium]
MMFVVTAPPLVDVMTPWKTESAPATTAMPPALTVPMARRGPRRRETRLLARGRRGAGQHRHVAVAVVMLSVPAFAVTLPERPTPARPTRPTFVAASIVRACNWPPDRMPTAPFAETTVASTAVVIAPPVVMSVTSPLAATSSPMASWSAAFDSHAATGRDDGHRDVVARRQHDIVDGGDAAVGRHRDAAVGRRRVDRVTALQGPH